MNRKSLIALVASAILVLALVVAACGPKTSPGPSGSSKSPTPTVTPGGADIEVISLQIEPNTVLEGETADVVVEARNYGGSEGTISVTLAVDGTDTETKDVTVAGGASSSVTFAVTKDTAGTYVISAGPLTSILTVLEETVPITPPPEDGEE